MVGEEEEESQTPMFKHLVWELQGLQLQIIIKISTEVFNSYIQNMGTAECSSEHPPENTP